MGRGACLAVSSRPLGQRQRRSDGRTCSCCSGERQLYILTLHYCKISSSILDIAHGLTSRSCKKQKNCKEFSRLSAFLEIICFIIYSYLYIRLISIAECMMDPTVVQVNVKHRHPKENLQEDCGSFNYSPSGKVR